MGIDFSLDAWATSLEAAKANTLASSTVMATHLNGELKKRFLSAFESWKTMVLAGKLDNTNPPKPPAGYDVMTSENGFAYPELGDKPVCVMPEIPADYTQPQVHETGPADVVNIPPGFLSRHKAGEVVAGATLLAMGVPAAQLGDLSSLWVRVERGTPFGMARFYARL